MPTGYTAAVQNGEVETLEDYALACARAFGALVTMRDEPTGAEIPKKLIADTGYHDRALAKAKEEIEQEITLEQCEIEALTEYTESLASNLEYNAKSEVQTQRYRDMLAKVNAWALPSEDHKGLRDFMIKQLEDSIEFDGHTMDEPEQLTGAEWLEKRVKRNMWDIEYHTRNIKEEIDRVDSRNVWLTTLFDALGK